MLIAIGLAVLVGFLVTQAAMFATTVHLHRGLTHRALVVHPTLAFICRLRAMRASAEAGA
jgi:fatty-acid desaturase